MPVGAHPVELETAYTVREVAKLADVVHEHDDLMRDAERGQRSFDALARRAFLRLAGQTAADGIEREIGQQSRDKLQHFHDGVGESSPFVRIRIGSSIANAGWLVIHAVRQQLGHLGEYLRNLY